MLRTMLESGEFITAPGVYDGLSAMFAEQTAFKAVYLGGYCAAASRWGLPDAGLVGLSEVLETLRVVRRVCSKPVIVDGDTGFGGLLNVQHTVREIESAGAAALQLEDQEMPKKCGHTKGKRVIDPSEMAAKIAVAVESRHSDDFLIIARTDSRQMYDLDEALRRCRIYRDAGADILFIDAPQSMAEVERIGSELEGPLMVNMVPPQKGFHVLDASTDDLKRMGFAIAFYPGMFASSAIAAMEQAVAYFEAQGVADPAQSPSLSMHDLVGFPEVWEDEARWQGRFGASGIRQKAAESS